MNDARSGWRDNIELALQYNKIADTLVERSKVLMQNFEALFATMGESATGPVKDIVNGLIQLVKGFTEMAKSPAGQVFSLTAIAAGILAGTLLLVVSGAARSIAAMQGLSAGLTAVTGSAAVASATVRILGIAMASLGIVAAVGAVIGVFVAMANGAQQASNAVQDTSGALAAMRKDAEAGSGFAIGDDLNGAKESAKDLSSQAENLGRVLGFAEDKMYGAGTAAADSASKFTNAALSYGKASREFVRGAVTSQKAFTDLFTGDKGTNFADTLVKNNFDLDKALDIATREGEDAVKEYVSKVTGVSVRDIGTVSGFEVFDTENTAAARKAQALFDILNQTGSGMRAVANQAYASGEGFVKFSSATEMNTDALEDFKVQNEDVINSMAEGFAKFVDTGSLIGLTQQMQTAFQTLDDGTTDIDEHADAIAGFETAWSEAYGGAKFSIEDYMTVFRRAAGEQQTFIANLQTLSARGVPTNIIGDLAAMGPQAQQLVGALINSTDEQLDEYVALYGTTGFDSMVALAAGQLAAEQIVRNAASSLSTAQLQELSADLAAGTPLTDAMAKWQLDAEGKPLTVEAKAEMDWYAQQRALQQQAARLGFNIPITPYLTKSNIYAPTVSAGTTSKIQLFAGGGYTGPGGKWDAAGLVHRGEYVFPQADVNQSTGRPKDSAMLRMLAGGRVPRGGSAGYANGGYANGSAVTELSARDRKLLMDIANSMGIYVDGMTLTTITNNGNARSGGRGSN
jgi:hypothetical protein